MLLLERGLVGWSVALLGGTLALGCGGGEGEGDESPSGEPTTVKAPELDIEGGDLIGAPTEPVTPASASSEEGEPTPPAAATATTMTTTALPVADGPVDPSAIQRRTLSAYGSNECWIIPGGIDCYSDISFFVEPYEVVADFVSISLGEEHLCGLDTEGNVLCFGEGKDPHEPGTRCSFNDCGQSLPPAGAFTDVASADEYTCGIDTAGTVHCWGEPTGSLDGAFTQIDANGPLLCGLTTDGAVMCTGQTIEDLPGTYSDVAVGPRGVCAITSGAVHCRDPIGEQAGDFASISVGEGFACGLLVDGTPLCWGDGARVPPPVGTYARIASADEYACAASADGAAECWGEGRGNGSAVLQCNEVDQALLAGTLGGAALDVDWGVGGAWADYGDGAFNWELSLSASDVGRGYLLLSGDASVGSSDVPRLALDDGQTVAVSSGILIPPSEAGPEVHCVAGGTASRVGDEALVELSTGLLGACPDGDPVEGEITFCRSSLDGCEGFEEGILGTLDGVDPEFQAAGYIGIGTQFELELAGGFMFWSEESDGALRRAFILSDPSGPLGGAIYCAGEGSNWVEIPGEDSFSGSTIYTLTNLTRLGTCEGAAAGTDTVSGCVR